MSPSALSTQQQRPSYKLGYVLTMPKRVPTVHALPMPGCETRGPCNKLNGSARMPVRLQDTMRQHEWKISSLQKENRALELANTELRAQLQAWKQENLEVGKPASQSPSCSPSCPAHASCMYTC
jgi:hypothetical protein